MVFDVNEDEYGDSKSLGLTFKWYFIYDVEASLIISETIFPCP